MSKKAIERIRRRAVTFAGECHRYSEAREYLCRIVEACNQEIERLKKREVRA